LTTGTSATRSADIATITGTAFSGWYNQGQGTVYVAGSAPRTTEPGGGYLALNDPAGGNRIDIRQHRATPIIQGGGGASASYSGSMPTISAGTAYRQAVAWSATVASHADAINGTLETSSTAISNVLANRLAIAMRDGQGAPTGGTGATISRVSFWPQRLPNANLQALTA
jgi:hypothetical protein